MSDCTLTTIWYQVSSGIVRSVVDSACDSSAAMVSPSKSSG